MCLICPHFFDGFFSLSFSFGFFFVSFVLCDLFVIMHFLSTHWTLFLLGGILLCSFLDYKTPVSSLSALSACSCSKWMKTCTQMKQTQWLMEWCCLHRYRTFVEFTFVRNLTVLSLFPPSLTHLFALSDPSICAALRLVSQAIALCDHIWFDGTFLLIVLLLHSKLMKLASE